MSIPSLSLAGKTAVVTGASRSIGYGIALKLAQQGANLHSVTRADARIIHPPQVVLGYTSASSSSQAAELKATIESLPHRPKAHVVQADLGTLQGPGHLIGETVRWAEAEGMGGGGDKSRIDILVNNAGLERVKGLAELSVEDYNAVFDINVRGAILLTQAALPHLNPNARIVNVSSVGARAGFKSLGLYCSSKAALEALTRCWAAELGENGTTVNAVSPGPVQSQMLENIPKEIVEMQKQQTPVQNRLGTIEEIADVVAWLAGPSSSWITGQTISASGGWAMY
ncbi:3-oxoacyl-(acyl-carrier-protein) reductase [Diaporthe helianthi]|uniref:3-oxoacyl-(Acyl-carrier-protein) reductase n=1 Tax=Diaporthe helianthi TaxID=158607 RepID=A0A2P5ID68_DIAHE|nr:3-oxoacyl-(acyl-carrier-protein) reductase [Diaporthe helianthi]